MVYVNRGYYKSKYRNRKYNANYKTKNNKNYRKNKNRKVDKVNFQSLTVRQTGVIAPDRYFVRLRYTDDLASVMAATGQAVGYVRYRANSPYDPNPTGGNNSSTGFDKMALLFNRYRVHASTATLTCVNQEDFPSIVMLWPSNDTLGATGYPPINYENVQQMLNSPYVKWRVLSSKGGMDRCVIKNYISTKKIVGSNSPRFDDSYSALVTASPSNYWYWNIACYTVAGETYTANMLVPVGVKFEFRMTQHCEFYERKDITTNNSLDIVDPDSDFRIINNIENK